MAYGAHCGAGTQERKFPFVVGTAHEVPGKAGGLHITNPLNAQPQSCPGGGLTQAQ